MARALARPIKTARDHKNASALASKALKQAKREPDAEHRLQALLNALEKYDGEGGDEDYVEPTADLDDLPGRRWSDDPADEA